MGPALRVLLVEDSPSDVLLLREALPRAGGACFDVRHAETLHDALAQLTRPDAADVVLLDLCLPDSDGLATFLELRQHAPALPVVVLTGRADETLGVRAVQAGAQDYLVKGQVEGPVLVRALRYAVERRSADETVRRYADRLERLSRRLLDAQEAERRRVARELHDEIGQVLTAVMLSVQAVKRHVAPAGLPRLEESIEIVNKAIQQVRDLSLDLRPSLLDDLGLVAALRWCADRQARRGGFAVRTTADALPAPLPPDVETVCFRVAQEALTNVARHSQARQVEVTLSAAAGELHLAIADDGVGFDPAAAQAAAAAGRGLGLLGMRERVHLAGGRLELVSGPDRGTEVHAWLPLPAPREVGCSN